MDAKAVILAAGAIETPRLMLLSGMEHELLGRNLMVHYQTMAVGELPMRLHGHKGRSVTHVHDDFMIGDDASKAAAKKAGLPWIRGGLVEHAAPNLPIVEAKYAPFGGDHASFMRHSRLRERLACMVMQGEDLAYPENRVDLDPSIKDVRGFPVARITYEGKRHEKVASNHYGPKMQEIVEHAGALWTLTSTSPGASMHGGASPVPESRHVMGTARMGSDPKTSVVDPFGRVHEVSNVIVADSSVFVTATGYGPTLTLVALAARATSALCESL
jgi:gluconate 2-dehydrogenase alpha chain